MTEESTTRYCARGEQCTQYATLGEPQKLSRYSPSDVCEPCREKAREARAGSSRDGRNSPTRVDKPELHPPPEEGARVLSSAAEDEVRRLKYEMVISLAARRGLFWRLVQEARERWGIEPAVRVPPPMGRVDPDFPGRTPNPYVPASVPDPYDEPEANTDFVMLWHAQLWEIYERVVPEDSLGKLTLWDWGRFIAVCVLNDPPYDKLLEFVAVCGPEPDEYLGDRMPDEIGAEELPRMLAPPIKTLQDLRGSPDRARDFVLHWMGEVLDASGLDPGRLLSLIEEQDPGALERYEEKTGREARRHFIEVTHSTTWDHLKNAFSLYRASQEARPESGSPSRDRLRAFQCAVLHDKHGWTYRELAERYGFASVYAAKYHVKQGRKDLREG